MTEKEELEKLHDAIRDHRDQKGDDRCFLDDYKLYEALGEPIPEHACRLNEPETMMRDCKRYIECRHDTKKVYLSPQRTIDNQLERITKLEYDLRTLMGAGQDRVDRELRVSENHRKASLDNAVRMMPALRSTAKDLGYALALHGSLVRDIDLIACPWDELAVDACSLAEAIRKTAESICGQAFVIPPEDKDQFHIIGCPGLKHHGRRCWSFHLGHGTYIDLSVMPRRTRRTRLR